LTEDPRQQGYHVDFTRFFMGPYIYRTKSALSNAFVGIRAAHGHTEMSGQSSCAYEKKRARREGLSSLAPSQCCSKRLTKSGSKGAALWNWKGEISPSA